MFVKQIQVGHMAVFAYLVGDPITKDALVIDPADDGKTILGAAATNGLRINYIVNTHGHVDHIGGNAEMKRLTGAKIIVHADDAVMLTSTPPAMLRMFGATASPPPDILVQDGQLMSQSFFIHHFGLRQNHTRCSVKIVVWQCVIKFVFSSF